MAHWANVNLFKLIDFFVELDQQCQCNWILFESYSVVQATVKTLNISSSSSSGGGGGVSSSSSGGGGSSSGGINSSSRGIISRSNSSSSSGGDGSNSSSSSSSSSRLSWWEDCIIRVYILPTSKLSTININIKSLNIAMIVNVYFYHAGPISRAV